MPSKKSPSKQSFDQFLQEEIARRGLKPAAARARKKMRQPDAPHADLRAAAKRKPAEVPFSVEHANRVAASKLGKRVESSRYREFQKAVALLANNFHQGTWGTGLVSISYETETRAIITVTLLSPEETFTTGLPNGVRMKRSAAASTTIYTVEAAT